METYYKRYKGWRGDTYYVRMTDAEVEARRKLGCFLSVVLVPPVMILIFALAAGLIRL